MHWNSLINNSWKLAQVKSQITIMLNDVFTLLNFSNIFLASYGYYDRSHVTNCRFPPAISTLFWCPQAEMATRGPGWQWGGCQCCRCSSQCRCCEVSSWWETSLWCPGKCRTAAGCGSPTLWCCCSHRRHRKDCPPSSSCVGAACSVVIVHYARLIYLLIQPQQLFVHMSLFIT